MASNYTENYQLPLWAADDAFLRTEFNDAHEKIDVALKECGNCRIVWGNYTGNGTYGQQAPTVLSFDGIPLLVCVSGQSMLLTAVRSSGYAPTNDQVGTPYAVPLTWGEHTLSWYGYDAPSQLNMSGKLYYFIALFATGKE